MAVKEITGDSRNGAESGAPQSQKGYTRKFSKIIITLDNILMPEEKLSVTPSMEDGLDRDTETNLRILGCDLIQSGGILLKLPQVAMATAQIIFQRFYYEKSFVRLPIEIVAMASLVLASKVEESPRRNRDIINVFHHMKQVRDKSPFVPLILDQNYITLKNDVIKAERRILKELGFCVHVKHPHKIIVMYLQILERERNTELVQTSWNYMNDSLRTDVFVRHSPEKIACACISLAARQLEVPLPHNPSWYLLFGASDDDVEDICLTILRLYARPKPNFDELDKVICNLKKAQKDAKLRLKGSIEDTPLHTGAQFSPSASATNSPLKPDEKGVKRDRSSKILDKQRSPGGGDGDRTRNGKVHSGSMSPSSHSPSPDRKRGRVKDKDVGRDGDRLPKQYSASGSSSRNLEYKDRDYDRTSKDNRRRREHSRNRKNNKRSRRRRSSRSYSRSASRSRSHSRSASRSSSHGRGRRKKGKKMKQGSGKYNSVPVSPPASGGGGKHMGGPMARPRDRDRHHKSQASSSYDKYRR